MTTADRAARYVDATPGAVSGAGGHASTFALAMNLIHGFQLPLSRALDLLASWNCRCQPPWAPAELEHKIQSAAQTPPAKPPGWLMDSQTPPATESAGSLTAGTLADFKALASLRRIPREGVAFASERGLLKFGEWHGHRVWAATDPCGKLTELRRMDGQPFPAIGTLAERKSHALRGSQKNWPVGCQEAAPCPCIALVEGMPDFVAAHGLALWEQASHHTRRDVQCAPVAMLSGSPAIAEDALVCFAEKVVRIFPHPDKTGISGARKWQNQLLAAGAKTVDMFDFGALNIPEIKDLCELVSYDGPNPIYQNDPDLFQILPSLL
jgi:hypothetical protein